MIWSQNGFSLGERGSRSWKNGWLSEVNWLEGFYIKVKRVTGFLQTNCIKNRGKKGT